MMTGFSDTGQAQVRPARLRRVLFVPRRRAIRMRGRGHWAMVSITDVGYAPADLSGGWGALLRLSFDDIDPVTFPGWDLDRGRMTPEDAAQVARFLRTLPAHVTHLFVHCEAGISRSGGVAKAIAERMGVSFPEDYAEYNRHVYGLCRDALLATDPHGGGDIAGASSGTSWSR